jgi:hypothetical protein
VISPKVHLESPSLFPPFGLALEGPNSYAVHTKARHERRVAAQFEEKNVCTFLPLLRQAHRWSDRSTGRRVRIRGGSLYGMQGILVGHAGEKSLVVLVELPQRSVSIRVEG